MSNQEVGIELANCPVPWCGARGELIKYQYGPLYWVICSGYCGATIKTPNCSTAEEAVALWNKREPVSAWIAVSERLPEPNVDVLIYNISNDYHVAWIDPSGKWFDNQTTVTHWQPLPPLPADKQSVCKACGSSNVLQITKDTQRFMDCEDCKYLDEVIPPAAEKGGES